uniref:Transposase Tc1-like domain-containing protein n=1 Tax=Hippocampus comes TaxID=109280 RepID=A0A3Q2Z0G7_HIPCM
MGKARDLSEFERGMIVGIRIAGRSISETVNQLGFSKTAVSRVYRDWCSKKKTRSERGRRRKPFVDELGEKQMERVVEANNQASITEIQRLYNCTAVKPISIKTTQRVLKRLGYTWKTSRRDVGSRYGKGKRTPVESSSSQKKDTLATDLANNNNTGPETSSKSQDCLRQDGATLSSSETFCAVATTLQGSECS